MFTRALGVAAFAAASAVFVLSAAVQYNDPDPALWVAIYVVAAVSCVGAAAIVAGVVVHGRVAVGRVAVATAVVAVAWAATLVPAAVAWLQSDHDAVSFTMKTGDVGEELARECGGLTLVVVAELAVASVALRRRRRG